MQVRAFALARGTRTETLYYHSTLPNNTTPAGNLDYHSTRPNNTTGTRVSLDFRVVPGQLYTNDYAGSRRSESGVQMFAVGTESRKGFYKIARKNVATDEWRSMAPRAWRRMPLNL